MKGIYVLRMILYPLLLLISSVLVNVVDASQLRRGLMEENEADQTTTEDMNEMDGDKQEGQEEVTDPEDDMMNGSTGTTTQQQQQGLVDLVHLVPFDVQIAVTINMGIQTYEVSNIVTDWFNDAYKEQLDIFGYTSDNQYAEFSSVVLFNKEDSNNQQRRKTQSNSNNNLFVAKFRGGAVFTRDTNHTISIPDNDVLVIQQNILLDDTGLFILLKQATDATGLGDFVIDVNAFLNPSDTSDPDTVTVAPTSNNSGLDVVIIVAIVIAIIAFLFLLGAIIWAYRFDRDSREAYLLSNTGGNGKDQNSGSHDNNNPNDKTTSETETVNDPDTPERIHRSIVIEGSPNSINNASIPSNHFYPTVIGGSRKEQRPMDDDDNDENDPESVISDSVISGSAISEDISTSLSQYYRAGMGKADYGRSNGMLSDAGSVSSMESYGYSLDGGMSMAIPTEIPYQQDRQRIGGLPIEPDAIIATSASREGSIFDERSMDDVQILDLDKELSNLNIKLLPKYVADDDGDENHNNETYSQEGLEKYQLEDFKEMAQLNSVGIPTIVSTTSSSTGSKASSRKTASSKGSSKKSLSSKNPIDTDSMMGTLDDDDDSFNDEVLPKLQTEPMV